MHSSASAAQEAAGSFQLAAGAPDRFAAQGPLTFASARAAHEQGLRTLASAAGGDLEIDCAGVTSSDSAGLAVLLDWLGVAKRAGHRLCYTHLPADLVALARISEVEELLERGV